MTRLSSHLTWT